MVRAPIRDLAAGARTLDETTAHYIGRVLRLRPGDSFVGFDRGREADVMIESADRVSIGELRSAVTATIGLTLVYALAKGDKVDSVIRDATELGATRIIVARTSRSVSKAEGERAASKLDRWRRIAEQAARQSRRADPPTVEGIFDWSEALGRTDADARFCLWENATAPLGPALFAAAGKTLAFAVGPEGGLTEAEVTLGETLGFSAVSLGPIVLRTETVPAAVLGAVRILTIS